MRWILNDTAQIARGEHGTNNTQTNHSGCSGSRAPDILHTIVAMAVWPGARETRFWVKAYIEFCEYTTSHRICRAHRKTGTSSNTRPTESQAAKLCGVVN